MITNRFKLAGVVGFCWNAAETSGITTHHESIMKEKMRPFFILFAVLIPLFFTSCEHAIKYKEVSSLSPKVFLTTQDACLLSRPNAAHYYPFLRKESDAEVFCTSVQLKHEDVLIPQRSKIEISKIYAVLTPIYGGPIPSCRMMRSLYLRMMDTKTKKFFWMMSGYHELTADKFNQVRSIQIDELKSPVTGKTAVMSVPFNIWNEQDMVEYTPSPDKQ